MEEITVKELHTSCVFRMRELEHLVASYEELKNRLEKAIAIDREDREMTQMDLLGELASKASEKNHGLPD